MREYIIISINKQYTMQHFGDNTAMKHEDEQVTQFDVQNITSFGSGDTTVHNDFLSTDEANDAFDKLFGGEIQYQQWHHMPDKKKNLLPLSRLKIAMAEI